MHVLIFDVDNTLTAPRRPISRAMAEGLKNLSTPFHLAAGSDWPLVQQQLVEPLHSFGFRGVFDAFVSNGANRIRCHLGETIRIDPIDSFRLRDHLGPAGYSELWQRLVAALERPEFSLSESGVQVIGTRLIDRDAMINLAPMGRPGEMTPEAFLNREAFVAFDRRTAYRRRMMEYLRDLCAPWQEKGLRVALGGQTSFDIVVQDYDKRHPLRVLLDEGFVALTYFGDALHEGGNDAAVLEFIAQWPAGEPCPVTAVHVQGWEDTLARLQDLGLIDTDKSCG